MGLGEQLDKLLLLNAVEKSLNLLGGLITYFGKLFYIRAL